MRDEDVIQAGKKPPHKKQGCCNAHRSYIGTFEPAIGYLLRTAAHHRHRLLLLCFLCVQILPDLKCSFRGYSPQRRQPSRIAGKMSYTAVSWRWPASSISMPVSKSHTVADHVSCGTVDDKFERNTNNME